MQINKVALVTFTALLVGHVADTATATNFQIDPKSPSVKQCETLARAVTDLSDVPNRQFAAKQVVSSLKLSDHVFALPASTGKFVFQKSAEIERSIDAIFPTLSSVHLEVIRDVVWNICTDRPAS